MYCSCLCEMFCEYVLGLFGLGCQFKVSSIFYKFYLDGLLISENEVLTSPTMR